MSNDNHIENESDDGYVIIYVKRFWHKRAGRFIHAAPGKAFRFRVKARRAAKKKPKKAA